VSILDADTNVAIVSRTPPSKCVHRSVVVSQLVCLCLFGCPFPCCLVSPCCPFPRHVKSLTCCVFTFSFLFCSVLFLLLLLVVAFGGVVVLCCVVLCCVVLCCVVLCCVVLCCVVLCCVALCCVALCCVVLRWFRSSGSQLLATYRCQEQEDSTNRLQMSVRTVEGQHGELQALVIARIEPKTAQSVKVNIKPLSMHHRLHEPLDERAVNTLRLTGTFTLSQMHEWVCFCLPDVPARLQEREVSMNFRNCFLGTILSAEYRKGEAVFKSDSVSTIAILKEVITRQATALKIRVNLSFDIVDETIINFLRLIHPKLTCVAPLPA